MVSARPRSARQHAGCALPTAPESFHFLGPPLRVLEDPVLSAGAGLRQGKHTIVLFQATPSRDTRTFHDYESLEAALDGASAGRAIAPTEHTHTHTNTPADHLFGTRQHGWPDGGIARSTLRASRRNTPARARLFARVRVPLSRRHDDLTT